MRSALTVGFLFWATALFLSAVVQDGPVNITTSKPNILWIVVDDMSANFSCYGEKTIQTPHVDRLAQEGLLFNNAFVTAPVCSSCRSAFITGMYQTSIGAHHHRSGQGTVKIFLPNGVRPIPQLFQEAGYYTCIGDGLMANELPPGLNKATNGLGKTDYNFEWDKSMYNANDWAGRKPGQPFFMQVQTAGGKLRGDSTEKNQRLAELAKNQFGNMTDANAVILPPYYPRDPVLLNDWASYLDAVRFTDNHVGKVIARLEREGILNNTLIIFITDHGISHARGKQFLYHEGTHIPFIVRGPGISPGTIRNDLIEHIDMAAISLAAAGIPIPSTMQGENILAADYQPRQAVFAARDRCGETVDRIRSVRSAQYLYIRNFYPQRPLLQPSNYKDSKAIVKQLRVLHADGKLSELTERLLFSPTRPVEELYAWTTDRWQLNNLSADPTYATVLSELRGQLDCWMVDSKDQGAESAAQYDSDMAAQMGPKGNPAMEQNIRLMKQWASEGK